jgi:hypothetical protein
MTEQVKRIYNLQPEKLNHVPKTDYQNHPKYVNLTLTTPVLPATVDLRSKFGPIRNQGNEGSCTGFSTVAAWDYDDPTYSGSPQFQYYNSRLLQGTTSTDSGSTISTAVRALATYGLCQETTWPYTEKFTLKPSTAAYTEGAAHKAVTYSHVTQTQASMKACLISGFPFVFGFIVYQSFEYPVVTNTGMMPMPKPGEQILGGHAVVCCGYEDSIQCWIIRNSWGPTWGAAGYFYMPYAYLDNTTLCSDLWVITKVNTPSGPMSLPDVLSPVIDTLPDGASGCSGSHHTEHHPHHKTHHCHREHHGHTGHTGTTGLTGPAPNHNGTGGDPPCHSEHSEHSEHHDHHKKKRRHCRKCHKKTHHLCKHCRRCRDCHRRH